VDTIIGIGEDDIWHSITSLCQLFVPKQMDPPAGSFLYAMSAKLRPINFPTAADNHHGLGIFETDAFVVCI
jgi:hypothetical protein